MVPHSIGLQLRFKDTFVVVRPIDDEDFSIDVTDVAGRAVTVEEHDAAIAHLLKTVSKIRKQAFEMLGGKIG